MQGRQKTDKAVREIGSRIDLGATEYTGVRLLLDFAFVWSRSGMQMRRTKVSVCQLVSTLLAGGTARLELKCARAGSHEYACVCVLAENWAF